MINKKFFKVMFFVEIIALLILPCYLFAEEEEIFLPNMHMQLGCETCHATPATVGEDTRETVKLTSPNNDVNALCEPCHVNQEVHPFGVAPGANMKIPDNLPLGLKGTPSEGKIICTTCHDIHAEFSSGKLLRGFAQKKGMGGAKYVQKIDLCKDCHGLELMKRSPHKGDEKSCSFCHGADPKKIQEASTIKMDVMSLCNFCHVSERVPHFLKFKNLFTDKEIKEDLKKMTLPLSKGKLTCATCHNPHGTEKPKFYLREEFVVIGGKSNKINPHWTTIFCTSCHDKKPEAAGAGFKFNNSPDATCLWCHKGEEAVEYHVYGNPAKDSPSIKIQKDKVKIVNDTVSCISCHGKDCEKKPSDTGRYFLSGGPYTQRNDMCFNCHILDVVKKINPHRQKDMQGKPNLEICQTCHIGVPDEEKKENFALKSSELFLCLICHPDRPHPGADLKTGAGINHLVVPKLIPNKMVIPADVPMAKNGKLMCSSCHPGHLEGITKKAFKPRLSNECTDCHVGI